MARGAIAKTRTHALKLRLTDKAPYKSGPGNGRLAR